LENKGIDSFTKEELKKFCDYGVISKREFNKQIEKLEGIVENTQSVDFD